MNTPNRIQFTNGNVTKYVYSATGEKLRTVHQTAAPNITVAMDTAHELTASELLYTDSTDYYLGGKLTVKNGRMDKYFFDGGYAQAKTNETTLTDNFSLYYYNSDHLRYQFSYLSHLKTIGSAYLKHALPILHFYKLNETNTKHLPNKRNIWEMIWVFQNYFIPLQRKKLKN
ncbi:MAG: hypothetical protein II844_00770 [Prevotella sp.]|nr:hypothetical protein [Prevotella sp.]